ncbi:MAG: hypothetical protein JWQ35_1879 [Bacteriovoracaceae bacterium]|nr:hypothetical protein [Bacteriovoracaceae bacterium]
MNNNQTKIQFKRHEWKARSRGQTMMEYIVLVALLAVASIPIAKILGDVFRDRVLKSADEIAGGGNYDSSADTMVQEGKDKVKRSMKDF